MIADKMRPLVENNSAIRMMFEEGREMAKIYGNENVYDFSLGNPSVSVPKEVTQAIMDILKEEEPNMVHGYMSNAGYEDVRAAVAASLNRRFQTGFHEKNILMTVGAASGLNIVLKTLLNPGEEVIVFAPYFVEYGAYVRNVDGSLTVISPDTDTFQPNLKELEEKIGRNTRMIITNSPNNPTGVVYSEETIIEIGKILERKEKEFGKPIFWISDEPYRELAYDGVFVPYITKYYNNTIVCYSFSKSLSLPGERIGYLVIPDELEDSSSVFTAAAIANRVLGCVNAPSLMQRVIQRCIDVSVDLEAYDKNRSLLYDSLISYGFECIKPQGAFYLFVKSPVPDEREFCNEAKKRHILFVPGASFGCPGFIRIAYCVSPDSIKRSLPAFKELAKSYQLGV